jgi:hypothetical protein
MPASVAGGWQLSAPEHGEESPKPHKGAGPRAVGAQSVNEVCPRPGPASVVQRGHGSTGRLLFMVTAGQSEAVARATFRRVSPSWAHWQLMQNRTIGSTASRSTEMAVSHC